MEISLNPADVTEDDDADFNANTAFELRLIPFVFLRELAEDAAKESSKNSVMKYYALAEFQIIATKV